MAKKTGFDLHQLLSERSRAEAKHGQENRQDSRQQAENMEQLTLDVYDLIPSKENFYSTENIDDLKQSISLVGILQPLLVKRDGDKYRIKAGHRRRLACMALADEGQKKFRFVPCVIRQETEEEKQGNINAILDRLTLIFANGFREKTDWEKMEEVLQTEALVVELRKEVSLEGRTRAILAEFTGIKEAQLGRYKAIKNNLCPRLMEEFKADNIGISVVYELSGLSAEYQERAYELYQENKGLTISDAKTLKRQEEDAQQIPGQMEFGKQEGQQAWQQAQESPQEAQEAQEGEEAEEETAQEAEGEEEGQEEAQEAAQEAQEAPEEEEAEENTNEAEKPQESPQEGQEKVVYVERQPEKVHGCAFCHPHHHREISTAEGNVLLAYDPESHMVQIISKETGDVENIVFHCCPMCGRKLG
ncbi:ParB/RepB/Spo0J family partition protein [Acetatifactor aquisgranensis]|uniref:ParB/RepB/Spo0J family partition protein n=1 Tax=Acetatifactor aquisgranensis TaxID=2941233 RepID=UPI00203C7682|nr:ParB/RepB/Spo0J family partition protein [Acetatifactor aquisgranensis]